MNKTQAILNKAFVLYKRKIIIFIKIQFKLALPTLRMKSIMITNKKKTHESKISDKYLDSISRKPKAKKRVRGFNRGIRGVSRKKYAEDSSSGNHSSCDADASDSSPKAQSADCVAHERELIDTSSPLIPCNGVSDVDARSRRESIKRVWSLTADQYTLTQPILWLTDDYVDYLGNKLNKLHYKFTISPYKRRKGKVRENKVAIGRLSHAAMIEILFTNKMSELIKVYCESVNGVIEDSYSPIKESTKHLFELLASDYKKLHSADPYCTREGV